MDGKVIVITGASGGIGAAAAELLAAQGHSVVLVAARHWTDLHDGEEFVGLCQSDGTTFEAPSPVAMGTGARW